MTWSIQLKILTVLYATIEQIHTVKRINNDMDVGRYYIFEKYLDSSI